MLDMITASPLLATTAIQALGSPVTTAPYMLFNKEASLFSICGEDGYQRAGTTSRHFNTSLFQFFYNLSNYEFHGHNTTNGLDYRILIKNNLNNLVINAYNPAILRSYENKQEYLSADGFHDIDSIVFVSNLIPLKPELLPNVNNNSGTPIFLNILTDFTLQRDELANQNFVYNPQIYRLIIDLKSREPLTRFD